MDDMAEFGLTGSPGINSVLKPPKPRIPLKELMSTAHEEDNTAVRKRRVSFANVNKIKEFSAGAESMVVCHTPAYEEPFSFSSDSSCPSGVDGWTPAKSDSYSANLANISSMQKENDEGQLFIPQIPDYTQTANTLFASASCNLASGGMDLSSCIGRGSLRNSARFSVGMELTEIVTQSMYSSGESMDLTKGAVCGQSYKNSLYSTDMNVSDGMLADDSDALELTDAVIDPRFCAASTRYSVNDMDLTRNLYSVNNTRYSVNGMDLTKGAVSQCPSGGRQSSRYSLSNMDLTEAIGNNSSGLEFTEVITEPNILSARYSVNNMDLTEVITRLTPNSMEGTDIAGDKLDSSNLDLTMPMFNIHQSASNQASILPNSLDLTGNVKEMECGRSACYSANMDSLELGDSASESEDTPTTQTYNGSQQLSATKSEILHRELSERKNKAEDKVDEGSFGIYNSRSHCLPSDIIQDKFVEQKLTADSFIVQLEDSANYISNDKQALNLIRDNNKKENDVITKLRSSNVDVTKLDLDESVHSENSVGLALTKPAYENNGCFDIVKSEISSIKDVQNSSCIIDVETRVILKTNETLEKEHITLVNDESMDLSEPLVLSYVPLSRKSLNPVVDKLKCSESRNDILEMDITVSSPEKKASDKKESFINVSLKQQRQFSNDGGVESIILPSKQAAQTLLNDGEMEVSMSVSFSESNLAKPAEDYVTDNKGQLSDSTINGTENVKKTTGENDISNPEINEEVNQTHNEDNLYNQVNQTTLNQIDREKSCEKTIEEDSRGIDCSLHDLTISSDLTMNASKTNTPCGRNITMTRGGASWYITAPHDSTGENSKENTITMTRGEDSWHSRATHDVTGENSIRRNDADQPSELESSLPLIQRMDQKTITTSEIHQNETKDRDIWCRNERGSKRSFEIALEPENDTEESPVKQICLPSEIHLPDSDCLNNESAPSFSMDKLITHHQSVPRLHKSEFNISLNIVKSPTHNALFDVNIERKSFSENNQLKVKATNAEEHSVFEEDQGNNFSLTVDLITHHDISEVQSNIKKQKTPSHQIQDHEKSSVVSQQMGIDSNCISKDLKDVICPPSSQIDLPLPHKSRHTEQGPSASEKISLFLSENSLQPTLLGKGKTTNTNIENYIKGCDAKSNRLTNTTAVTLKTTNMFRKDRKIRALKEGVFGCDLIPKWTELQFSVEPNGSITNTSYTLVCPEREKAIGEYLLQQVKSVALPEDAHSLITVLQEPHDTFFTRLAKNLSLICKYFGGTLKGNILTLELVSCKRKFWTFVHVNIKYPKYLSAEDINISEQRIGELKLSNVRSMFGSVATGPDQLLNFAAALTNLQY